MPFLMISGKEEKVFPLVKNCIRIGRHPKLDIILADENFAISRMHAEIIQENERYHLKDLGSRNGTRLNEERLEPNRLHPLKSGDKIQIGSYTLKFFWNESDPQMEDNWPEIHQEIETKTLQIGIFNLSNFSKLSPSDQRLALLFQLGEALQSFLDIPSLLKKLLELIFATLNPEYGFIGVYDEELRKFKYERSLIDRGKTTVESFSKSSPVIESVMSKGKGLLTGEINQEASKTSEGTNKAQERVLSVMCCPILNQGKSLGVIYVDERHHPNPFTKEDLKFLSFLGIFAGKVISSAIEQDLLMRRTLAMKSPDFSMISLGKVRG